MANVKGSFSIIVIIILMLVTVTFGAIISFYIPEISNTLFGLNFSNDGPDLEVSNAMNLLANAYFACLTSNNNDCICDSGINLNKLGEEVLRVYSPRSGGINIRSSLYGKKEIGYV